MNHLPTINFHGILVSFQEGKYPNRTRKFISNQLVNDNRMFITSLCFLTATYFGVSGKVSFSLFFSNKNKGRPNAMEVLKNGGRSNSNRGIIGFLRGGGVPGEP